MPMTLGGLQQPYQTAQPLGTMPTSVGGMPFAGGMGAPSGGGATQATGGAPSGGNFTIPMTAFPYSTQFSNQGSSQSSNSGINWNTPFMQSLLPQLQSSAANLRGDIEGMGQTLQDQYANLMRRGMGPEAFQGTLNSLANRGMLNSSVAGDSMAGVQKGTARMIADQQFNSMLAQQQALQNIPNILANLAQLGQESSSRGGSYGSSQSYQANPLAPYELMSRLFMYQPTVQ